jgi:hypothetical protein
MTLRAPVEKLPICYLSVGHRQDAITTWGLAYLMRASCASVALNPERQTPAESRSRPTLQSVMPETPRPIPSQCITSLLQLVPSANKLQLACRDLPSEKLLQLLVTVGKPICDQHL